MMLVDFKEMSATPPNMSSNAMIAIAVAIPEKKFTFFRSRRSIGVIKTKYRLTTLEIATDSMPLEPNRMKTLNPVRSSAKKAPFASVFFFTFKILLALAANKITIPMILVIHTKENVDTLSGTLIRKTYWIAARNVMNTRPNVAIPFLPSFIDDSLSLLDLFYCSVMTYFLSKNAGP